LRLPNHGKKFFEEEIPRPGDLGSGIKKTERILPGKILVYIMNIIGI